MTSRGEWDVTTLAELAAVLHVPEHNTLVVITCSMCDVSIGISNSVRTSNGKLSLHTPNVKVGVTVCYGCGMRSRFGRVYSTIDITRVSGKVIVKRLIEEATKRGGNVSYITNMVYLKHVITELKCELFTIIPGQRIGTGLRVDNSVCTDMIRS
jgi:hypothetical protein